MLLISSIAFPGDSKFARYNPGSRKKPQGFEGGFGQKYLGNDWAGRHGSKAAAHLLRVPEQASHPILFGVKDGGFCYSGAYHSAEHDGITPLIRSQPLLSRINRPDIEPDTSLPPIVTAWTYHYNTSNGKSHRVFHSTHGASVDFIDPDYRRLVINGVLWSVGMEKAIHADGPISFVGPYHPTQIHMVHKDPEQVGFVQGQMPQDLAGFQSPIGAPEPVPPSRFSK